MKLNWKFQGEREGDTNQMTIGGGIDIIFAGTTQ